MTIIRIPSSPSDKYPDDCKPRIHKHRYCGVLAPNAKLRKAVIETAGPSGATLQLLTEARDKMDIDQQDSAEDKPQSLVRRAAARCWPGF